MEAQRARRRLRTEQNDAVFAAQRAIADGGRSGSLVKKLRSGGGVSYPRSSKCLRLLAAVEPSKTDGEPGRKLGETIGGVDQG